MANQSFREKEAFCERHFAGLTSVFHVCSSEDFEIIFSNDDEFETGMNIFGVCCKLCPDVRVFTFQLMSNHFHIVAGGSKDEIMEFVKILKKRIHKFIVGLGRRSIIERIEVKCFPINSLEYFRSAIAYVNRNGFVVNDSFSPYSYPWGANSCYFNTAMKNIYYQHRRNISMVYLRSIIHSKKADDIKDLFSLGNYISPFSYCDISSGEAAFRDEKQYFYFVSKNVETYGNIAKEIGERMAYTDEDVYYVAAKYSIEKYGLKTPSLLNPQAKLELARKLHFEYNAGKKQIQRILKISDHEFEEKRP